MKYELVSEKVRRLSSHEKIGVIFIRHLFIGQQKVCFGSFEIFVIHVLSSPVTLYISLVGFYPH